MNPRITRRARAEDDLADQAAWYIVKASPRIAERFLEAVEHTAEALLATPGLGVARTYRNLRLAGMRMTPVRGFGKHLIFYRQTREGIEIVRVLHGARDLERILREG